MSEAHYLNKLYPLQNKVLQLFNANNIRHYLTGGTALSRIFLHHRYSDDLDLFMNNDSDFEKESDRAIGLLHEHFSNITVDNRQSGFRRVFITQNNTMLKLDFVNDVAYHLNGFIKTDIYYRTDNPLNILSNKISALNRQAAKDIADIIWICKKYDFTWTDMIEQAQKKDSWVNEIDVLTAIKTFDPKKLFADIIWITVPEQSAITSDIKKICFDIASAGSNSLYSSV